MKNLNNSLTKKLSRIHGLAFLAAAAALAATAAHANDVFVGNSPIDPVNGNSDGISPFVIMGEYNPSGPSTTSAITLPNGKVSDVQFYGGNYDFTLYALSEIGAQNNEVTYQVNAAETFSGSSPTETQTLAVKNFPVSSGEFLAFAGIGPYYPQQPDDAAGSDATYKSTSDSGDFFATGPGGPGTEFTVGLNGDPNTTYDYISDYFGNQGRTYAIGVNVTTPSGSVPDTASTALLLMPGLALMALLADRQRR